MMNKFLLGLSMAMAITATAAAQAFKIGDKAPSLGGKVNWLKGEPVNEFKPGQVYVIDFWATWCAPCIEAMPKINALANDYRDKGVTVIGAAIWPQADAEPTDEYVRERGDAMNFVVAEDIDSQVAQAYMASAELAGIPITMVINQEGRLAWIGHPQMDVESIVDQVLAGEYDLEKIAAHQREIARGRELLKKAEQLALEDKWDESFALIDEIVAIDTKEFGWLSVMKFQYLIGRFGREADGYAYGKQAVDSFIHDNPVLLENVARFILEGPGFQRRDYDLAFKAISRADELTEHQEPAVLMTLAEVHYAKGDVAGARDALTAAISLTKDERVKADMMERLAEFQDGAGQR